MKKYISAFTAGLLLFIAIPALQASDTSIASIHIYSVKENALEEVTQEQKKLHEFYRIQPGFISSFVLADTNHANLRQDYSFWRSEAYFRAAIQEAKTLRIRQKLDTLTDKLIADQIGRTHGASHHNKIKGEHDVVEMAVFDMKRPFQDAFLPLRPTIKEWLDHHRGTNGYISIPAIGNDHKMADVVLWTNLEDALYAANLLTKIDFGKTLGKDIESMAYYGHFYIHEQYFGEGF